jgi:hypothetical protein
VAPSIVILRTPAAGTGEGLGETAVGVMRSP